MSQHNARAQTLDANQLTLPQMMKNATNNNVAPTTTNSLFPGQQTTILTASGTMTITSTTAPSAPHHHPTLAEPAENKISIVPIPISSPSAVPAMSPVNAVISANATSIPAAVHQTSSNDQGSAAADPELSEGVSNTPSYAKERKRRIVIDDDDESPTFNPLNRGMKRIRGRGRRGRSGLTRLNQRKMHLSPEKGANSLPATPSLATATPAAAQDDDSNLFTSPEGIVSRQICLTIFHFYSSSASIGRKINSRLL